MGMQIIHQSQSMIQVPVIYHLCNKLIALWCNSSACEIHFTIEHQFCQKLKRDHQSSPSSGEYFVILLDSLTIHPWRDHGSDRNTSGMLLWLICSCHFVFLGTSSSGSIQIHKYLEGNECFKKKSNNRYECPNHLARLLKTVLYDVSRMQLSLGGFSQVRKFLHNKNVGLAILNGTR